ncbi:hypothetical protein F5Y02DRAFT_127405 [Annulohypoxylon stygium]|nr:hypothetical protein F5Y02DRAFT_127405 [Annulohypoxylon stygium]
MLSRIKGAIDRSIAEEQARQRALAEQRSSAGSPSATGQRPRSVSRTNSTNTSARRKAKKPSQDTSNGDGAPNPDPAVFEAAFVLDDEDADPAPGQATSAQSEKTMKEGAANNEKNDASNEQNEGAKDQASAGAGTEEKPKDASSTAPSTAPTDLPPQVKTKLRKLEKLEATYPGKLLLPHSSLCSSN